MIWLKTFLFFGLVCLLPWEGRAEAETYKISGVHVDVTAKDVQKAQDQAFVEGQKEAFHRLFQKLTRQSVMPSSITPDLINSLSLSHTVDSEKRSSVRYIATLSFYFDKNKIEDLLSREGIDFNPYKEKTILIVPLLKEGETLLLWESNNPWLEAWAQVPSYDSLHVSFELPEGSLQDIQDLSAAEALDHNAKEIQKLIHRYDTQGAIVALYAKEEGEISSSAFSAWYISSGEEANCIPLPPQKETYGSLGEAAANLSKVFDHFVQSQMNLQESQRKRVEAVVKITSLPQWLWAQKTLKEIPLIRNLQVESLARDQVRLSFEYVGSPEKLVETLKLQHLELTPSSAGKWHILPLEQEGIETASKANDTAGEETKESETEVDPHKAEPTYSTE